MANKRKTKRQKQVSDKRHSQDTSPQTSEHFYHLDDTHVSSTSPVSSDTQTKTISVADYGYLLDDLKKISIVTGIIVILELGIYWTSVGF